MSKNHLKSRRIGLVHSPHLLVLIIVYHYQWTQNSSRFHPNEFELLDYLKERGSSCNVLVALLAFVQKCWQSVKLQWPQLIVALLRGLALYYSFLSTSWIA